MAIELDVSDEDIIITGRRKHYYLYNLEKQNLSRIEGNFALSSNKINLSLDFITF